MWVSCPSAGFKLAGVGSTSEKTRATEVFIGKCPTIRAQVEGVELSGLLDTGSQVTLMQESLVEQHFSQAKLGKTPIVFQLRAANGLEIPYTSYPVLDMVAEGVEILTK